MNIGNLNIYGIIYKITNKINKKVYIGQTSNERGFEGRYCRKGNSDIDRVYKYLKNNNKFINYHLLNSIEKYGFDVFEVVKIFDIAFSKEELDIKEKCWISIYNSTNSKYGYNNNEGGSNGKASNQTKIKASINNLGFDIRNYKNYIINEYTKGKSTNEIGNILQVAGWTISRYLKLWGIKIRDNSASKIGFDLKKYKNEIINIYKNNFVTLEELGKMYSVSGQAIRTILLENNVLIRDTYTSRRKYDINDYKNDILYLYNEKNLSISEISNITSLNENTIRRNMMIWGVKIKSISEIKLGFNIEDYKQDIIYQYTQNNKTINYISKLYGVNDCVIRNVLTQNNIHIKGNSEIYLGFNIENEKENIINMYANELKSCERISRYYENKISGSCINSWLKRWGISLRNSSECNTEKLYGKHNPSAKKINVYDINMTLIKSFETKKECAEWLKCKNGLNTINTALSAIDRSVKLNKPYKNKYYFRKY